MSIASMNGLVAALAGGQKRDIYKANQTAKGDGYFHSLWKAAGSPIAGATPAADAGAVPTKDTAGAIPLVNPVGDDLTYLAQAVLAGATLGKIIVYDRLWANSGMSGTVTGSRTTLTTPPDLTRPDALGADTELWGEVYTAFGASVATLTVGYLDQDGNAGDATYASPNVPVVGQMFRLMLASGDTGVRKAVDYVWSVTTGTAGDFGLVILRRVAEIPISQINVGMILDFAALGLPQIYDDACLAMMVLCSTTNTGVLQGSVVLGHG